MKRAVNGGNLSLVQLLLDHGADPNAPEGNGAHHGAGLFVAAVEDWREIADLLLAVGANPNATVDSSGPAISWAKQDVRRALLKAGALEYGPWGLDASGAHEPGWAHSQLTTALREGHPVILDDDEYRYEGGWGSFAHCVCECGDLQVLDLYVEEVGTEKLHELQSRHCRSSDPALVDRLIFHGINPDNRDSLGRTILHYAAEDGNLAVAECLLKHGADIDATDVRRSTTPLGYAAHKGQIEMVRFLLDKGADPKTPVDREWALPMAYAELAGHVDVAKELEQAAS